MYRVRYAVSILITENTFFMVIHTVVPLMGRKGSGWLGWSESDASTDLSAARLKAERPV